MKPLEMWTRKAWEIAAAAVKEAEDRFDLHLYARVETADHPTDKVITIKVLDQEQMISCTKYIPATQIMDMGHEKNGLRRVMEREIRELAKLRDGKIVQLAMMDSAA
jgi:hypothetical protein